jgi:DnaJ-class molecular chaperone
VQINLAYQKLRDPEEKANYDKFGNTNQNNYFQDNLFQLFKDFFHRAHLFLFKLLKYLRNVYIEFFHRAHNFFEDFLRFLAYFESGEKTEESINKKFVFLIRDHLDK